MRAKLVAINGRYTHSSLALFHVRNELESHCPDVETEIIQLTDHQEDVIPYADVVAVGETVRGVAEGDKVFFNTNSGRFIEIDGEELIMVTIHDIFIVFDE